MWFPVPPHKHAVTAIAHPAMYKGGWWSNVALAQSPAPLHALLLHLQSWQRASSADEMQILPVDSTHRNGPLATLLFVGCDYVGKTGIFKKLSYPIIVNYSPLLRAGRTSQFTCSFCFLGFNLLPIHRRICAWWDDSWRHPAPLCPEIMLD